MATWPLIHADAEVPCCICSKPIGLAKTGKLIGFGHLHGNYFLRCTADGQTTGYDVSKNQAEIDDHALTHGPELAAIRAQMREVWVQHQADLAEQANRHMRLNRTSSKSTPKPVIEEGAFDALN